MKSASLFSWCLHSPAFQHQVHVPSTLGCPHVGSSVTNPWAAVLIPPPSHMAPSRQDTQRERGGKRKRGFSQLLVPRVSSLCVQCSVSRARLSFCYRLALLDLKLADKKRHLGECLLGKLNAILIRPYGQSRPYLSEFKQLLTRKMLSKGFSKLGVQSLSGACSGLQPRKVTGFL